MNTKNDTSKPETEFKQEAGEGCPGASCCGSFDKRLTAAIAFRQGEMSTAIEMRFILKNKDHPEHAAAKKLAVNQLTAGLGLCYLAGMSIKEMMQPWVESMEKAHPEILPHNTEISGR